jgi:small subunit ribosomal protein S24e
MKKFEPHYRLVRVGAAQKIEKASRQQRMSCHFPKYNTAFTLLLCFLRWLAARTTVLMISRLPPHTGKQRKNRAKEVRGTAKTKGATKDKKK